MIYCTVLQKILGNVQITATTPALVLQNTARGAAEPVKESQDEAC
jgi:hypothetical protein